jgi:hypothetical protein
MVTIWKTLMNDLDFNYSNKMQHVQKQFFEINKNQKTKKIACKSNHISKTLNIGFCRNLTNIFFDMNKM